MDTNTTFLKNWHTLYIFFFKDPSFVIDPHIKSTLLTRNVVGEKSSKRATLIHNIKNSSTKQLNKPELFRFIKNTYLIKWVGGGGVATTQATATCQSYTVAGAENECQWGRLRLPYFSYYCLTSCVRLDETHRGSHKSSQNFSDRNIWQCKLTKSSFTLIESVIFFFLSSRRQSPNQRDTCRWRRLSPFVISTVHRQFVLPFFCSWGGFSLRKELFSNLLK